MGISTFFGLNIGVNALDALQEAQSVVSNNIANSNTPGYVQESVAFGEATPFPPANYGSIPGQVGQGVDVQAVQRETNAFLEKQDRLNQGSSQMYSTHNTILDQIQSTLNEPSSNSIQNALDQFFTAWQTLSHDPSSTPARQSVITQAQTLGQTFGTVTAQLEQLQTNLQNVVVGSQPQYTLSSTGTIDSVQLLSQMPGQYVLQYTGTGSALTVQLEQTDGTPIGSPITVTGTGQQMIGQTGTGPALSIDVASLTGTGSLSLVPSTMYFSGSPGVGAVSGTGVTQALPPVSIVSGTAQLLTTPTYPEDDYQIQMTALGTSGSPSYSVQLFDGTTNTFVGSAVSVTSTSSPVTIGSSTGTQFTVSLANLSDLYSGALSSGTSYTQTDNLNSTAPGGQVGELNLYANQVYQLNKQILSVAQSGESPNTLLDQRDVLLDQMSQLANVSYTVSSNNVVSVTLGSVTLVSGTAGTTPLTYSDVAQMANVSQNASGWAINSGSMTGNLRGIQDAHNLLQQFDSFLSSFANQVNAIQTSGYPLQGNTPAPALFNVTQDVTGHVALAVPNSLSTDNVAASSQPNQSGNNTNALNMLQLQSNLTYNGGTFDQGVAQIISQVGIEAGAVQASQKTAAALAQQSTTLRQSVSGVDINQQAALMVQYQNSYNAAAKFISVFDQMLQTLINMV